MTGRSGTSEPSPVFAVQDCASTVGGPRSGALRDLEDDGAVLEEVDEVLVDAGPRDVLPEVELGVRGVELRARLV